MIQSALVYDDNLDVEQAAADLVARNPAWSGIAMARPLQWDDDLEEEIFKAVIKNPQIEGIVLSSQ